MPVARDVNGNIVQAIRLGASYDVADDDSPALGRATTVVRIAAITDARVWITDDTATAVPADATLMPAGAIDYFAVRQVDVVRVIGSVNVTECG